MHLVIARLVPGLPAGGVEQNFTARLSRSGIEMDFPALEIERSVDGVSGRSKGECRTGLAGVQMQGEFLRGNPRNGSQQQKCGGEARRPPNSPL